MTEKPKDWSDHEYYLQGLLCKPFFHETIPSQNSAKAQEAWGYICPLQYLRGIRYTGSDRVMANVWLIASRTSLTRLLETAKNHLIV